MKLLASIFSIGIVLSVPVQAASVGNCLYPKTRMTANGYQQQRPVFIYASPVPSADKQALSRMAAFMVTAVAKGGWVQLSTVPDYSQPDPDAGAGRIIGWAHAKDFDQQALRNCT
ncbi:hypothetical protein LH442_14820 [Laribacter hongkongensis]|uniref:hypothetical protein n=1 Tax=Laribacter hongkongensis TaxID=168471 RepID=UPI001EFE181B|nr:hypothetical protein [Laribacter hongkongensis]MCG9057219.1 hypothetical protein [Laribacter hongkongensis]MCG9060209.1 hypothetical protein [Laribacter hongkongensis]MCG9087315.1 hypothetical protein [Laribacter hongkongensis]